MFFLSAGLLTVLECQERSIFLLTAMGTNWTLAHGVLPASHQLALSGDWRGKVEWEKHIPLTFCQLQVRYLIALPSSISICLPRISEPDSSSATSNPLKCGRTGAILGPTLFSPPPSPNLDFSPMASTSRLLLGSILESKAGDSFDFWNSVVG